MKIFAFAILVVILTPSFAFPCSPATTGGEYVLVVPGRYSTVPANLPALAIDASNASQIPDLVLSKKGGETVPTFIDNDLLRLSTSLVPGTRYEVHDSAYTFIWSSFDTSEEAELPTELGELIVHKQFESMYSRDCDDDAGRAVHTTFRFVTPNAFTEAMQYTAELNDESVNLYHDTRENDFKWVTIGCNNQPELLSPGLQTLTITGTLPGTEIILTTKTLTFDVQCEGVQNNSQTNTTNGSTSTNSGGWDIDSTVSTNSGASDINSGCSTTNPRRAPFCFLFVAFYFFVSRRRTGRPEDTLDQ